jgi:hypothetical protein
VISKRGNLNEEGGGGEEAFVPFIKANAGAAWSPQRVVSGRSGPPVVQRMPCRRPYSGRRTLSDNALVSTAMAPGLAM